MAKDRKFVAVNCLAFRSREANPVNWVTVVVSSRSRDPTHGAARRRAESKALAALVERGYEEPLPMTVQDVTDQVAATLPRTIIGS